MNPAFAHQYRLVCGARAALLDYCATLGARDFVAPVPAFNNGCIRNTLVHVAGAYQVWLGHVALARPAHQALPDEVTNVATARALFASVDALVAEFGGHFADQWLEPRPFQFPRHPQPLELSPLQLFTHVITHEFHHKGQILSMSRLLGHVPVDTDIIRF